MRIAILALGAVVLGGALAPDGLTAQVPQIPATFYGAATIDGQAPPAGTAVRGFIDGVDCTQPGAAGTIDAGSVGAYVISVMHESQQPGCGSEGKQVTFTIGGRPAQTAVWHIGLQEVGLNAGTGSVQPLPSNVPTPIAQATPPGGSTPSGPPPTDDIDPPGTLGGDTPRPPGLTGTGDDDGDGPPVWGILVVALMGLGVLGGAAGFVVSRRRASADAPVAPETEPGPD
ncbi:MAG: hypothetical protein WD557_06290 [Dehalococcoidia bacterium]